MQSHIYILTDNTLHGNGKLIETLLTSVLRVDDFIEKMLMELEIYVYELRIQNDHHHRHQWQFILRIVGMRW